MDFITGKKCSSADPAGEHDEKSSSELLSSAKLVAEAAQSVLHKESDKVDKGKVAGATSDLLGAAKGYGKLGDEGIGKYLGQAESYLKQYESSTTATPPAAAPAATKPATSPPAASATADAPSSKPGGDKGESGTDYLKMAQGFLGKN